jgi:hypothetical protein
MMRHRKDLPVRIQCTRTIAHTGGIHADRSWMASAVAEDVGGGTPWRLCPAAARVAPGCGKDRDSGPILYLAGVDRWTRWLIPL